VINNFLENGKSD